MAVYLVGKKSRKMMYVTYVYMRYFIKAKVIREDGIIVTLTQAYRTDGELIKNEFGGAPFKKISDAEFVYTKDVPRIFAEG